MPGTIGAKNIMAPTKKVIVRTAKKETETSAVFSQERKTVVSLENPN
jgi:hypothetical protein